MVALALAGAWACDDVTDVDLIEVPSSARLFGQAYLDLNGSGVLDGGDTPLRRASVTLVRATSQEVVREASADSMGNYSMPDVPLGTYDLLLGSTVLGDSLTMLGSSAAVTLEYGDTTRVDLGATYPILSLAAVRSAPPGQRVFTHGIALNSRQSNGDGVVHFQEGTDYLRATNVQPVSVSPGDSVRLLGRTAIDNAQPILDGVTLRVLRGNAVFITVPLVTIATADSAGGGALDAALVQLGAAEIGDTATVGGHLHFWAYNGVDSVEVVLRDFLQISPNPPIRPDTIVRLQRVTGLLSPYFDGSVPRWRLSPRARNDIQTQTKQADVAIGTSFNPTVATAGETVEIVVTARNVGGNVTATGVAVSDTIDASLTLVSSTATRGSYDQLTHTWTVGDLTQGAMADTLRIQVQTTAPGIVSNRARFGGLVLEVDTNSGNNTAVSNPNLTVN
jgi:uncharacterized repeat protein (TIGR01451 family)